MLPHPKEEPAVWKQTATGIAFDLLRPTPGMVDFEVDVPESLARIARFDGHVRAGVYSVAQHSVLGADALKRETGRDDIAAAFLLHDVHEAFMGDIATPVARALENIAAESHNILGPVCVREAIRTLKQRLDVVVHAAAGVAYPLADDINEAVKLMDMRMLETERIHLMRPAPFPWGYERLKPVRIVGRIRVWPWPDAADEFRERLTRYLPHLPHSRNPFPTKPLAPPAKRTLTPA